MKRTVKQNNLLYKLLIEAKALKYKDELVMQFTRNRTQRTSEMTVKECAELIDFLKRQVLKQKRSSDRMRKTVISLYRSIGYNKDGRADMERINADVKNFWGKSLNEYTDSELIKIISVLKNKIIPHKLSKNG